MKRRFWTPIERDAVRRRYPHERTDVIARDLGRTIGQVYNQAHGMGLHKTPDYFERENAGRIQRGRTNPKMVATQFPKGHVPANKGLRRPGWAPGRMAETQFKKGEMSGAAQHNYVPIGSTRITKDGYLERKTTDDPNLHPTRRWQGVHRLVWEAEHGSIPEGYIVAFKPGQRTTVESEITVDRLECITRAENMRRNTIHRYPKEVVRTNAQLNWLKRRIKKAEEETA